MGWVIRDPEQFLDDRGDAFGRPNLTNKAKRGRALCQGIDQLSPLFHSQARGRSGGSPPPQRNEPTSAAAVHPLTHRPLGHAQGCRNILLFPALLVQFPCPLASSFPPIDWFVLRCSCHATSVP